jgi:hypothetical protein
VVTIYAFVPDIHIVFLWMPAQSITCDGVPNIVLPKVIYKNSHAFNAHGLKPFVFHALSGQVSFIENPVVLSFLHLLKASSTCLHGTYMTYSRSVSVSG